jgi:hypothetical protein
MKVKQIIGIALTLSIFTTIAAAQSDAKTTTVKPNTTTVYRTRKAA